MSLFGDKKESDKKSEGGNASDVKKDEKVLKRGSEGDLAYKFVERPIMTEKTHELISADKYVFKLRPGTSKNQAKKAIEKLYGVKVEKVNIVNIGAKKRRFGRIVGSKSAVKKAIITLKSGNKIEFFE